MCVYVLGAMVDSVFIVAIIKTWRGAAISTAMVLGLRVFDCKLVSKRPQYRTKNGTCLDENQQIGAENGIVYCRFAIKMR